MRQTVSRMDPREAETIVAKANEARKRGAPDRDLENSFSVRLGRDGLSAGKLFVFRIEGKSLERELPLLPLDDPEKETFRYRNPLTEPIRA